MRYSVIREIHKPPTNHKYNKQNEIIIICVCVCFFSFYRLAFTLRGSAEQPAKPAVLRTPEPSSAPRTETTTAAPASARSSRQEVTWRQSNKATHLP